MRKPSGSGSQLLFAAGLGNAALAALHVGIIIVGASAYRYFGAGERLAGLAESGSAIPALVTAGIVAVLAVFAWYGWAGAGMVPRPPLLRAGLVGIAAVFLLRAVAVVPEAVAALRHHDPVALRNAIFSAAALTVGVLHAVGTRRRWRHLRREPGVAG